MRKFHPCYLTIITVFFLSACASGRHHIDNNQPVTAFDRETADLADVTADALDLAERIGAQNIMVVFDLDNTLLAMEQGLGSDQWYDWQKNLNDQDRCDLQNVGDRFAVQGALYFASAMRPTQTDAASQVTLIQDGGITVIALTSRGPDYRLQTFREIRRNGYDFTHSSFGPVGGYEQAFEPVEDGRMSRYEDGVFMTAGQHKGQMLRALLQKSGTVLPAVVVMADDKQKNLEAMKETFSALQVPVHAWRYTGEDENVDNFDSELANQQWASIDTALRQIQQVLGADNYDLSSAVRPADCN